jgi:alkaline phosphatase D
VNIRYLLSVLILLVLNACSLKDVKRPENFSQFEDLIKSEDSWKKPSLIKNKLSQICLSKFDIACTLESGSKWPTIKKPLSIMQGPTNDSKTVINMVLPEENDFSFLVWDVMKKRPLNGEKMKFTEAGRGHSQYVVKEVEVSGLEKDGMYKLIIFDSKGKIHDHRYFKALATKGKNLKIMLVSCMSDVYQKVQGKMWGQVNQISPDILFFIGDNVYVDIFDGVWKDIPVDPNHIWDRYVETRLSLDIYKNSKLYPVYAGWDDHDYGSNDGDKSFKYKEESQEIFKTFFSSNNSLLSQGKGIGYHFNLRGNDFYVLDNRSFRDSKTNKKGGHFGRDQKNWLYRNIKKSQSKYSWIVSGDQFFGDYHPFESFQKLHNKKFHQFLNELGSLKKKVLFISGDRHLSEIMSIPKKFLGYKTFEITSSGMHTKVFANSFKKYPNPLQVKGAAIDGTYNYLVLNLATTTSELKIDVTAKGVNKETLFQKSLKFKP